MVALGGVGMLICWQLATAPPGEGFPVFLSGEEESFHERLPPLPRVRLAGFSLLDASGAFAPAASRWGGWRRERHRSSSHGTSAPLSTSAPAVSSPPPPVTRLPPVLEERGPDGLPASAMRCTFGRDGLDCGSCRTDGDCPAGQGCVANRETRRFECMASECEEDVHCFPGSVCRPVTLGNTGASVILRCVPEGLRGEGEPCESLPVSPASSCHEGLRCVDGVCSVPCVLEDPGGCPAGHVCTDSLDGPGCFPDCRRLGCPDGQECSRTWEDSYQCLESSRGDCQETPCPEGQRCNRHQSRGRAVFWCAEFCNPLLPHSCPEGQVCGMGSTHASTCFRRCDPMDLEACGEGWTCATVSEDLTLFGCTPEL